MAHLPSNRIGSDTSAWEVLQEQLDTSAALDDPPKGIAARIAPVLMTPSREIVLFATPPPPAQGPTSLAGSIVIHVLIAAVLWFGLGYQPPVVHVVQEHLSVRQLDLHVPPPTHAAARTPSPNLHHGTTAPPGHGQPAPPASRPMTMARLGKQTLIQPDILKPITLPQPIPIPQVVLWAPSKTPPVKIIVPPLPEQPTAAQVRPSMERPNQEINLSDVNIAASNLPSVKLKLAPTTTSPIAIQNPSPVQLPPASASQPSATPTPAAVLSLSDIRLNNGTAALPPVNESQASKSPGGLASGHAQNPSAQDGNGAPSNKPAASGSGQNAETAGNHPGPASAASRPGAAAPGSGDSETGQPTSTPITLSRDGHFGAVIVGDSLDREFPELAGLWNGRVAYTAYLHVGLSKSWIMQYSLPHDAEAAAGGTVSRLEAPWPYNIVRPNLDPGAIDADALMIRGFVNQSGRFEDLSIVFPQSFSSAQFVLAALQQWQFRPATQNGQPARVEVLLIIPEEPQ